MDSTILQQIIGSKKMKKILVFAIMLILMLISIFSAYAYDPLPPEERMAWFFRQYFDKAYRVEQVWDFNDYSMPGELTEHYYAVAYSSPNDTDTPYFKRIGQNGEYYEYSAKTGAFLYAPSGIVLFYGNPYVTDTENHFLSPEWLSWENPAVFEAIAMQIGTDRLGYVGDANGDGTVNINDATTVQKSLAEIELLTGLCSLAADFDGNNQLSVADVTAIQYTIADIK